MAQAMPKAKVFNQYGPYGRQGQPTFNFILGKDEEITKVHIESGFIMDSLAFEIVDECGNVKTIWSDGTVTGKVQFKNGKVGFRESHTINLAGERITQISGFEGDYDHDDKGRHIVQLWIHTDITPEGYGPFGHKRDCKNIKAFKSPASATGPIIGFFGAQGISLRSLGVFLEKKKLGNFTPW